MPQHSAPFSVRLPEDLVESLRSARAERRIPSVAWFLESAVRAELARMDISIPASSPPTLQPGRRAGSSTSEGPRVKLAMRLDQDLLNAARFAVASGACESLDALFNAAGRRAARKSRLL